MNFRALKVRAEDLAVPLGAFGDMVAVGLTARVGSSDDDLIAATESYGAEVTAMQDCVVFALVPLGVVEALGAVP